MSDPAACRPDQDKLEIEAITLSPQKEGFIWDALHGCYLPVKTMTREELEKIYG